MFCRSPIFRYLPTIINLIIKITIFRGLPSINLLWERERERERESIERQVVSYRSYWECWLHHWWEAATPFWSAINGPASLHNYRHGSSNSNLSVPLQLLLLPPLPLSCLFGVWSPLCQFVWISVWESERETILLGDLLMNNVHKLVWSTNCWAWCKLVLGEILYNLAKIVIFWAWCECFNTRGDLWICLIIKNIEHSFHATSPQKLVLPNQMVEFG